MDSRSLEFKKGIGTTSDAHLDVKFEVADNNERDLLITNKSIKEGHIIYHKEDNLHYFLKTYPNPGVLSGVVWETVGPVKSNSLVSTSEETVLTSAGAKQLKDLIDDINFLDPNNPPVFIDGNDADNYKDSIRFTFSEGNTVDVSIKDLVDLGAFSSAVRKTDTNTTIQFLTLGDDTFELDLTPWFDLKLGSTESAVDSLKLGGELPSYYATLNALTLGLNSKEDSFGKNTGFNKDFGTTAGTVAEGNDSRIVNGQTAYNEKINSVTVTGEGVKVITLTKQDGSTLTDTFTGTDPQEIFLNSLNWDSTTGVFTAVLNDTTSSTVSLDGRYSLVGHNHNDLYNTKSEITTLLSTKYDATNFGKIQIDALGLSYLELSDLPTLYTSGDFDFDLSTKSTSDLLEGSNLYFTSSRVTSIVTKTYVDGLGIDATRLGGELPSYYAAASSLKNIGSHDLVVSGERVINSDENNVSFINANEFLIDGNTLSVNTSNINLSGTDSFIASSTHGSITIDSSGINIAQSSITDFKISNATNIILQNTSTGYTFVDSGNGLYTRYLKVGTPTGFSAQIYSSGLTSNRSVSIPDKSGTLIVESDLTSGLSTKEDAFTKNSAFNKDFGSSSGTVTEGDDGRLLKAETAWDDNVMSITISSGATKTITLTKRDGATISDTFSDIDTTDPNTDVSNVVFNTSTGLLTVTSSGGGSVSDSLDGRYSVLSHVHTFASLTGKPTTISGYGITDSYTETEIDTLLNNKVNNNQVLTNVPLGALFTDTTYSIGNGGLTEVNFTSVLNSKLSGIESGAQVNVNADWEASSGDSFIENKPSIPSLVGYATEAFVVSQGYVTSSGNTTIGTSVDFTTSGAEVVSLLELTDGVITNAESRTLTLGNLGYTGDVDANKYVHPSSHPISFITDLQTQLDSKFNSSGGTVTGDILSDGYVSTDNIRTRTNNHLIIDVGESQNYSTGQTGESLYVNAEYGLIIESSPNNWTSGWAGRITTVIDSSGITWNDKLMATQEWVEQNYAELIGDNIAYTNVNNNFTTGQDIQGFLRVSNGSASDAVLGLHSNFNTPYLFFRADEDTDNVFGRFGFSKDNYFTTFTSDFETNNITATNFIGNGSQLTNLQLDYSDLLNKPILRNQSFGTVGQIGYSNGLGDFNYSNDFTFSNNGLYVNDNLDVTGTATLGGNVRIKDGQLNVGNNSTTFEDFSQIGLYNSNDPTTTPHQYLRAYRGISFGFGSVAIGVANVDRYSIDYLGNHDFKTGTATFGGIVTAPNFVGNWNGYTVSDLPNVAYTNQGNSFTANQEISGTLPQDGFSMFTINHGGYVGSSNERYYFRIQDINNENLLSFTSTNKLLVGYKQTDAVTSEKFQLNGNMKVVGTSTLNGDLTLEGGTPRILSLGTSSKFRDNNGNALVISQNSGSIYLRPNGDTVTNGEFILGTNGNLTGDNYIGNWNGYTNTNLPDVAYTDRNNIFAVGQNITGNLGVTGNGVFGGNIEIGQELIVSSESSFNGTLTLNGSDINSAGQVTANNFVGNWNGETKTQLLNGLATEAWVTNQNYLIADISLHNTDIDSLSDIGHYQTVTATTTGTLPSGVTLNNGVIVKVNVGYDINGVHQELLTTPSNDGSTFKRYSSDQGSNWSSWVKMLDSNNFVAGTDYQTPLSNVAFTNVNNSFTESQTIQENLHIRGNTSGGAIGFNRNTVTGSILNSTYGAYQLQSQTDGDLVMQSYNSAGVNLGNAIAFTQLNAVFGGSITAPNFVGNWNSKTLADFNAKFDSTNFIAGTDYQTPISNLSNIAYKNEINVFSTGQRIVKNAISSNLSDYHLELYSDNTGNSADFISLRFHHGSATYGSLRHNNVGFHFTTGNGATLRSIYADKIYADGSQLTNLSITESQISDFGSYETAFSKNTAFNKDFGTTSGTVAQGNDSRIINGQTAFDKKVNSVSITGNSTKLLTLTLQDGSTLQASFTDIDTDTNTDVYLNGLNFNTSTGEFVAVLNDTNTSSVSIDGRYSLLDHTHPISDIIGLQAELNSKANLNGATFTNPIYAPIMLSSEFRTDNGQQLVLNAGESHTHATSQTAEYVYINAEQGLQVNFSPDNWGTGWAGRGTFNVNNLAFDYKGHDIYHAGNFVSGTNFLSPTGDGSGLTNVDATELDGIDSTGYSKRFDLSSQVQTASYRRSVIALCELTNTNTSFNSYFNGSLYFHRQNAINNANEQRLEVSVAKAFNTTQFRGKMLKMGTSSTNIRFVTFTYNGTKYGGVELYLQAAQSETVILNGDTNFDVFGLDIYDTQTDTIVNAEVYNSLDFDDFILDDKIYYNTHSLIHEGNLTTLLPGNVAYTDNINDFSVDQRILKSTPVLTLESSLGSNYKTTFTNRYSSPNPFTIETLGQNILNVLNSGYDTYINGFSSSSLYARGAERFKVHYLGEITATGTLNVSEDIKLPRTKNIVFKESATGSDRAIIFSTQNELNGDYNGLGFSVNTGTRTAPDLFIRGANGKIGIGGITEPSEQLHVSGNALFQTNSGTQAVISETIGNNIALFQLSANGKEWNLESNRESDAFTLYESGIGGGIKLTVLPGGDTGIGITPTEKLHVNGNSLISGTSTSNGFLNSSTNASYNHLHREGTVGQYTLYVQNSGTDVAKFIHTSSGSIGNGTTVLDIKSSEVSVETKLTVSNDALITGDIGSGTTNPDAPLHIYRGSLNSTVITDMIKIEGNRGDFGTDPTGIAILFKDQDINNPTNEARIKMVTVNDVDFGDNDESASNLIFSTTNSGVESDKMIITGRGEIGINVLNPTETLDIDGTLRIRGASTFGGSLEVSSSAGITSSGWIHLNRYASGNNVSIGNDGTDVNLLVPNGSITSPNFIGNWNSKTLAEFNAKFDATYFKASIVPSVVNGTDLNTVHPDGGLISNYGSETYWLNKPSGIDYGIAETIKGESASMAAQFFHDINHGTTNGGDLHYRTSNISGWSNWNRFYHSGNLDLANIPNVAYTNEANVFTITQSVTNGTNYSRLKWNELEFDRPSANYIEASDIDGYLAFRTGGTSIRYQIDKDGNHDFESGTVAIGGQTTITNSSAFPLSIERTSTNANTSIEFKQVLGSAYFGVGTNGSLAFNTSANVSTFPKWKVDRDGSMTTLGSYTIINTAPRINLLETDTTDSNWSIINSGGEFTIRTAPDDFSTNSIKFSISQSGYVNFSNSIEVGGSIYGNETDWTRYEIASGHFDHRFYTRTNTGAELERFKITGGAVNGLVEVNNADFKVSGDITIEKDSPVLTLIDPNTNAGSYPRIDFKTSNNQGISIEHNELDGELPTGGYGLIVKGTSDNTQFGTTGTLTLSVLGEIYTGDTTIGNLHKVLHEGNIKSQLDSENVAYKNVANVFITSQIIDRSDSNYNALIVRRNGVDTTNIYSATNGGLITLYDSTEATVLVDGRVGQVKANNSLSADNGSEYTSLGTKGITFNRTTSYLKPDANNSRNLYIGGFAKGSLDWANVQIYTDGTNDLLWNDEIVATQDWVDNNYVSTETNAFLGDGGGINTHPGTGRIIHTGQVNHTATTFSTTYGMPTVDNSNSILNINRHPGEYNSQLGFSSNQRMYYRAYSNQAIESSKTWNMIYDSRDASVSAGASKLVLRDSAGDGTFTSKVYFSNGDALRYDDTSNIFYADVDGGTANGSFHQATKWTTARTLTINGDASGSVSLDGTSNETLTLTVNDDSHNHSNYVLNTGDTINGTLNLNGSFNIDGNTTVDDGHSIVIKDSTGIGTTVIGTRTNQNTLLIKGGNWSSAVEFKTSASGSPRYAMLTGFHENGGNLNLYGYNSSGTQTSITTISGYGTSTFAGGITTSGDLELGTNSVLKFGYSGSPTPPPAIVSTFTPTANGLSISGVMSISGGVITSNNADDILLGDGTYTSKSALLNSASSGIKYVWANATEQSNETGMSSGDLGLREDETNRPVYSYNGSSWVILYYLDASHDHNGTYVTLGTNETITGTKTFTSSVKSNTGFEYDGNQFIGDYLSGMALGMVNEDDINVRLIGFGGSSHITLGDNSITTVGTLVLSNSLNVNNNNVDNVGTIQASEYIKDGGTSAQFLMANGAVLSGTSSQFVKANGTLDSNSYALSSHTHNYVSNQVGSGAFFNGVYLQFSGDNSANNDFISYNDTTNAYYFNADTSRTITSANADVYVKSLFTTSSVGIKNSSPSYDLDVDGTIRATGDILSNSDIRLKENIDTIWDPLKTINKLRGVFYTKKVDKSEHLGVIADEIQEVLPQLVKGDSQGFKSVAYLELTGLLIEGIKELSKEVELLKSKLN